jgi:hypothetical protein
MNKKRGPLLDHLDEIESLCLQKEISLRDIFNVFGSDGHFVLIFFLILPFLQPIPLFGLSTPFGLLIAFVCGLSYLGKPPWLPQKWQNKKISSATVLRIAEGSERIFEKISFLVHPRWPLFFKEPFRAISTILIIINAVLLALPLPIPFSNAVPAWMIFFSTLAVLEEDGFFIVLSYVQSLIGLVYFASLLFGLNSGLELLIK